MSKAADISRPMIAVNFFWSIAVDILSKHEVVLSELSDREDPSIDRYFMFFYVNLIANAVGK